jgi:pimeloyl-ACP methyl ester carboxylesterase
VELDPIFECTNTHYIFDSPLADKFTILAYDQRGLGQTDKPDIPYAMGDYANDAAGLLESQGWTSSYVIGVSFGGMVAQELAIRHKAYVKACFSMHKQRWKRRSILSPTHTI